MAKKTSCSCPICNSSMCRKCMTASLIVGIGFLLTDLGYWEFFGLQWYTVAFLMIGLGILFKK